jgi:hypothetical protein
VFVVCAEINAGVSSHGNGKNEISEENERLDTDSRENPHNYRGQGNDDEYTGPRTSPASVAV